MTVRDVMSSPVETCQPTTDLAQVTHLMWDRDCGFMPVVDANGRVAGVITDRDICVATGTRRRLAEHIAAGQVMATDVAACLPDDSLDTALETMSTRQVRRLPVIDASGHLKGVIAMNDIVRVTGKKGGPSATAIVAALGRICTPRPVTAAVA